MRSAPPLPKMCSSSELLEQMWMLMFSTMHLIVPAHAVGAAAAEDVLLVRALGTDVDAHVLDDAPHSPCPCGRRRRCRRCAPRDRTWNRCGCSCSRRCTS